MVWSYNFIEHTADIAVEVSGDSYEELFIAAANAWKESAVETVNAVFSGKKEIKLEETSLEELLVGFLSELNFILLYGKWLPVKLQSISISKEDNFWKAKILIEGTAFNNLRQIIKREIKAITFHQMDIKIVNGKYFTRIVFDI